LFGIIVSLVVMGYVDEEIKLLLVRQTIGNGNERG
jgi:hypothetical protein